eukprot:5253007-Pyramimonas_sp.AAC.1
MVKVPSPSWHALVESHNLIALREALGHQRHQLEDVKVKLSHSIVVELERFLNVTAVKEEIMHDMELVSETNCHLLYSPKPAVFNPLGVVLIIRPALLTEGRGDALK